MKFFRKNRAKKFIGEDKPLPRALNFQSLRANKPTRAFDRSTSTEPTSRTLGPANHPYRSNQIPQM